MDLVLDSCVKVSSRANAAFLSGQISAGISDQIGKLTRRALKLYSKSITCSAAERERLRVEASEQVRLAEELLRDVTDAPPTAATRYKPDF